MIKRVQIARVDGRKAYTADDTCLHIIGNKTVYPKEFVWTDGRCIYGNQSICCGTPVITGRKGLEGIPIYINNELYTYAKNQLSRVGSASHYKYKFMLNQGNKVYYWPYSSQYENSKIIAADRDSKGNFYTIKGFFTVENNTSGGTSTRDYVATVRMNNDVIFSVDCTSHLDTNIGIAEELFDNVEATPQSAYDNISWSQGAECWWGFVESRDKWAFIITTYATSSRLKGSVLSQSIYYYGPDGERLLFHVDGTNKSMEPMNKNEYISGANGLRFPVQDGYYYTMDVITPQPNVCGAPSFCYITMFTPENEIVFTDCFWPGTYFTICQVGTDKDGTKKYLVGTHVSNLGMAGMGTSVGQDFSYVEPKAIYSGLYLCSNGILSPLVTYFNLNHCWNQRLRPMKNCRGWPDKAIFMA